MSEEEPPNLPHTYHDILHLERPEYGKNIPIATLMQLRHEAGRAIHERGVLQPYHTFEYHSSNSQSFVG